MSKPLRLICSACGYANEPERVYCHNCGAKLDRKSLPKEDPKRVHKEARRVKSLVKPKNRFFLRFVKGLVDTLILSLFVAYLALIFVQPRKLPPVPSDEERLTAPQLDLALERGVYLSTTQTIVFTEKMVNSYLANRIRSKPTELVAGLTASNESVRVAFKDGLVHIIQHKQIAGIHLYFTARYALSVKEGTLVPTNMGGAIGRAPVHPFLMNSVAQLVFPSLWKALEKEHKMMGRMQEIKIQDGQIILVTSPGRPPV